MKVLAVVFAALLAYVAADVQRSNERFVEGIIAGVIEDLSNQMRESGLDPLQVSESFKQTLPVTDLLVVKAEVEDFIVAGLSNIVLSQINYSILLSRLTFRVTLPLISVNIASSSADVLLLGFDADASVSGSLDIANTELLGQVGISIGIISGVSVRTISLDFRPGQVTSNLNAIILGKDVSDQVNTIAQYTVPNILADNKNDIDRVLEHYATILIEQNL
ncbi:unnamed protein product [Diatraea saccharalis]|uniref:Uncharacterized protein n=1 Tax=Diatraea saccharalis TaxID=40085 RepID=A0A9N9N313_9NEOP|nr:unnamed protein product [Diatraea saccharalis]